MKSLKLTLSFVLLFSILWPAIVTEAKDTVKVGKITAVSGKSEVKKSGGTKKFNAFKGMAITQGDTIITGTDGLISLDLDANKEVTIGASTTLTISQLVESAKALGGKTSLKLQNGQVLIKVKKKLEGDSRFEIETPTAIMGVMGTEFFVSVNPSQGNIVLSGVRSNGYLGVLEGTVRVAAPADPKIVQMIGPSKQLVMEDQQWIQGTLSLNELPLFALEQHLKYLNEEKNTLESEAAKKSIEQLLQQIKAAIPGYPSLPKPTIPPQIVYDLSSSGLLGLTRPTSPTIPTPTLTPIPTLEPPTPTPTPTPTATPTEAPTPAPTPAPTETPNPLGAPELDLQEFRKNIYDYLVSDREIVLPFTAPLDFNIADDPNPNAARDGVSVTLNQSEDKLDLGEVYIRENKLYIQLRESLPYGSFVQIKVNGGLLKDALTGKVQVEAQQIADGGFYFKGQITPSYFNHTGPGPIGEDEAPEFIIHSLGYDVGEISYHYEYDEEDPNPLEDTDYVLDRNDENTFVLKLTPEFLNGLIPEPYIVIIPLVRIEETQDGPVQVIVDTFKIRLTL